LEQADTNLKIEDLGPIKPLVNFHKCFISCAAECPDNIYFILEIVENTQKGIKKNLNKTSMTKATGPFRDSQASS
jgi:hypothetical protein